MLPPRAPPRASDKTLPARDLSHILATKVRVMRSGGGGERSTEREGKVGRKTLPACQVCGGVWGGEGVGGWGGSPHFYVRSPHFCPGQTWCTSSSRIR